ncbi:putative RlpA-like domain superfamily, kiwellin [Helianthus annuus]|nr:putative RlpA-like domain superfamily, kiwellin [Helianthus annuus]
MKQSTVIFVVLFSTLFVSSIHAHVNGLKATMTINSFEKGGDGGGPSECDGQYHSDNTLIVALSTRWYNHGQRCHKFIKINYKDRSVKAKVVDECDSTRGCKDDIVDASKAVWKALRVPKSEWGLTSVTWSDA